MIALILGVIYFGQEYSQANVMNINGAIFMMISNLNFQNTFAVIHVSNKFNFFIIYLNIGFLIN